MQYSSWKVGPLCPNTAALFTTSGIMKYANVEYYNKHERYCFQISSNSWKFENPISWVLLSQSTVYQVHVILTFISLIYPSSIILTSTVFVVLCKILKISFSVAQNMCKCTQSRTWLKRLHVLLQYVYAKMVLEVICWIIGLSWDLIAVEVLIQVVDTSKYPITI